MILCLILLFLGDALMGSNDIALPYRYHEGCDICMENIVDFSGKQFDECVYGLGAIFYKKVPQIGTKESSVAEKRGNIFKVLKDDTCELHVQWWPQSSMISIDIMRNEMVNEIEQEAVKKIVNNYGSLISMKWLTIDMADRKEDSPKVEIRSHPLLGRGLFAKEVIEKDEFIVGCYEEIYTAELISDLPGNTGDFVFQIDEHRWRAVWHGKALCVNHSCQPNCGVRGRFDLVAMRRIMPGEEILEDYACSDDSDWTFPGGTCLCGTSVCRGDGIVAYHLLPENLKQLYKPYIAQWIRERYWKN